MLQISLRHVKQLSANATLAIQLFCKCLRYRSDRRSSPKQQTENAIVQHETISTILHFSCKTYYKTQDLQ